MRSTSTGSIRMWCRSRSRTVLSVRARPGAGDPATAPPEPDDVEISRLAKLGTLEYERERKAAAERLDIRASILDRLVAAERETSGDDRQGRALILPEPAPWPEPIEGTDLLDALSAAVRGHVVMADHAADTAALWAVHTYLLDRIGISPRLAITSPAPGCGKTTALDVLARLVWRPLPTANTTASAVFRVVEMQRPTLLIDEADTFLRENEELRGILNSGHRQGGSVIRTVGEDFEPRTFSTFSACAIALIGKLPTTLADRSVPIELRRRRPDEPVEPFRFDRTSPPRSPRSQGGALGGRSCAASGRGPGHAGRYFQPGRGQLAPTRRHRGRSRRRMAGPRSQRGPSRWGHGWRRPIRRRCAC